MKICVISSSYPPSLWNSVGRTCYSISQGLASLGHSVTVATYSPSATDKFAKDKNVRIQYLATDGSATLPINQIRQWQQHVTKYLKTYCKNTDIFICIDSFGYKAIVDSEISVPVIGLCNLLYTVTGWLQNIGKELEKDLLAQELAFVQGCTKVLCNNKVTKNKVEQLTGKDCGSYTIGIPAIKDFEYTPKKNQVLYVGKLNREKGIERLLRVMPKLPWMHLVLCDQNNTNLYKTIVNKLASELGITNRIEYTGFLNTQSVWKLYTESEICVVPHIAEPFGYAAIYPMMLGTPTVVSTANSLPEIVGDEGDAGSIFSNIEELRFYLEEIHLTDSLRQMYSTNSREKILNARSLKSMVDSVVAYF